MSHPVKGRRHVYLRVFLLSITVIFLNQFAAYATIGISNVQRYITTAYQGSTGNIVLKFDVSVSGESVSKIRIRNDSSEISFGPDAIKRVAIWDGTSSADEIGSVAAIAGSIIEIDITDFAVNKTLYVIYDVDSQANASEPGGVDREAHVQVEEIVGTLTNFEPTQSAKTITILPSGLSYDQTFLQSMVPATAVGPGFEDVAMMKTRLRANNQDITLKTITIGSGDGSIDDPGMFAPTVIANGSYIKRITVYQDGNDNEHFDGFSGADAIAGILDLGNGNTKYEATVTINPAIIIPSDNTKMFFVFYDLGDGVPVDSTIKALLVNATGTGVGDLSLTGQLPADPSASVTIRAVNVQLVTANSIVGTPYYAIAGERRVSICAFTLETNVTIPNARVTIKNPAGTFQASGEGVSKVSLYKETSEGLRLVGATSSFANNTTAVIENVYLSQGANVQYNVFYDINVGVLQGTAAECQIGNIEGSSMIFGGNIPAPDPAISIQITPAVLVVKNLLEDAAGISDGDSFNTQIAVRNVFNTGASAVMRINTIRPTFYYKTIGGQDVSAEYGYTVVSSEEAGPIVRTPPNYRVTLNTTVTYNIKVNAENIKSEGPIIMDAFIDYQDVQSIGIKPQSVIMTRYLSGGSYTAAVLGNRYGTFIAKVSDKIPSFEMQLPSYVASMNVLPYGIYAAEPFLNGDLVEKNSKLKINLANEGTIVDLSTIMIYKNDVLLAKGTEYNVNETTGVITIEDLGEKSGTLRLTLYSGDVMLEPAIIKYVITDSFSIKDFFAGPSPYRPSEGSLYFSFQISQPGTATLYLYDSAGQKVWQSEELEVTTGYNEVAWDGTLDVGGTVGRGVYILTIIAEDKDEEKKEIAKTKFAVF